MHCIDFPLIDRGDIYISVGEYIEPVEYEPVRIPVRIRLVCGGVTRLGQWLTHKQGFD